MRRSSRYRNDHHLIPLRGETAAAQNVSALNAELATLANDIAQKQSVLDQVQSMQGAGGDVSSVAPLLNSPLVSSLIDREAGLANNEAELKSQYGSAHPQVIAATARTAQMRAQVRSEVNRAVAGLGRELAALNQRKAMLTSQMSANQSQVGEQGTDDVGLQALESNATSARTVYQSATTRLREIEAEGGMAQSDANLASEAIVPDKPDYPHKTVMLAGAFLGSIGLGTMLAFGAGAALPGVSRRRSFGGRDRVAHAGRFPPARRQDAPRGYGIGHSLVAPGRVAAFGAHQHDERGSHAP